MKKILFAIALAVVATACNNNESDHTPQVGKIAIEASTRSEVGEGETAEKQFSLLGWNVVPQANDLKVEITDNESSHIWNTLAEFNNEEELLFPSKPHTITLSYGEKGVEGWSKPYFEGSTTVEVPGFRLSVEAVVEVELKNSIVAIATTDNFNGYFPQSVFKVNGEPWDSSRSELLFMNAGEVTISCSATRQTGSVTEFESVLTLKPTTRQTIVFDLSTVGNAAVKVIFDDKIVDTIEFDFELNENA